MRCLTRHTFRHRWDTYKIAKKCRVCGGKEFWVDTHRQKRKDRARPVCNCGGYPHPHYFDNSMVYCRQHPTGPLEEDFEDRYGACDY